MQATLIDGTETAPLGVFIDSPGDVLFALGMLVVVVLVYLLLERFRPGSGNLPPEFSEALKWLDTEAGDARVLAWWDYAAPLTDYTDAVPVLRGPSRSIEAFVDDPDRVREWVDDAMVARAGKFFLADDPETAFAAVDPGEFDLLLVARSDLMKAPAMREAARSELTLEIEEPDDVMLRRLVEKRIDLPVAFSNDEVVVYRSPSDGQYTPDCQASD